MKSESAKGARWWEAQKMTMIEREVHDKVVATKSPSSQSQIEIYYQSHLSEFSSTQESAGSWLRSRCLRSFDVTTRRCWYRRRGAKAEGLRKRALKGDDFTELAAKYSDDDSKTYRRTRLLQA